MRFFFFFSLIVATTAFPRFYGEWMLWHSTVRELPDNRVVIHIYPDDQVTLKYRFTRGPFVFHKSKQGHYSIRGHDNNNDEGRHRVDVSFHRTEEVFLSAYGIGLQNLRLKTRDEHGVRKRYEFSMMFSGTDDIYLQSTTNTDDSFHIVKSARINEPSVDIPITTFIITQIIGTILGHVINELLFHTG